MQSEDEMNSGESDFFWESQSSAVLLELLDAESSLDKISDSAHDSFRSAVIDMVYD